MFMEENIRNEIEKLKEMIGNKEKIEVIKEQKEKLNKMLKEYLDNEK